MTTTTEDLCRLTLEQAEDRYRTGRMSQAQFEAYMHVWATSAFRYSNLGAGWTAEPEFADTRQIVADMREVINRCPLQPTTE